MIPLSHVGIVVECRTEDPEVPGSNPSVGKQKILRSNQKKNHSVHSGSKMEIPLSLTYPPYDQKYMMVPTKQNQEMHDTSSKVHPSQSGHMPGSDKSASGTSGDCCCSRTGTTTRVTGTGQQLIRPDSENMSEPP